MFARLDFVGLVAVIGFVAVVQRMMRLIVVVVDRQWKNLLMAVELLLKPLCLFLDLENFDLNLDLILIQQFFVDVNHETFHNFYNILQSGFLDIKLFIFIPWP